MSGSLKDKLKSLVSSTSSNSKNDGQVKLYCWGQNDDGQLGIANRSETFGNVVTDSLKGKTVADVACGKNHTLVVTSDGTLYGVGDNKKGQISPSPADKKKESFKLLHQVNLVQPMKKIVQLSCGLYHSACLTSDGRVVTYGQNQYGQLGHSHDRDPSFVMPRVVEGIPHSVIIQVVCGDYSTYMLSKQGKVYACGQGSLGRLGLGNIENQHVAKPVRGALEGNPVYHIAAGKSHCVCVSVSGRVYGWGNSANGELGFETPEGYTSSPHQIPIQALISKVDCGDTHTVLLGYDGVLYSCGSGEYGQLGHGDKLQKVVTPQPVAKLVEADERIVQVACGTSHTCILMESGKVSCFGKIGNDNVFTPMLVDAKAVFRLIAGGTSTFVMRLDDVTRERRLLQNIELGINVEMLKQISKGGSKNSKLKAGLFDMYSLNASFLGKNEDRRHNDDTSSMVDMEGMITSLDTYVRSLTDKDDLRRMRGLIAGLVAQMDRAAQYVTEPDQLRAYLILLVSPVMRAAPKEHEALVMSIFRLPEASRELLFQWIEADVPATIFKNGLVRPLIEHLDKHIEFQKWTGQAVTLCLMLSRLHDMVKGRLSSTEFYTDVPSKFSPQQLKQLYLRWRAASSSGSGATESPEFSLFKYPFLLSADTKRRFMKIEDQEIQQSMFAQNFFTGNVPIFKLDVRRDHLLDDTIKKILSTFRRDLKMPLRVSFIGEEGLDAGGVRKEFFQLLSAELFNPDFGMFREIGKTRSLWFNNNVAGIMDIEDVDQIQEYKIVGVIMGLAIYNDTLLDVQFPLAMYQLLLNRFPTELTIEDFEHFDPETAKQLSYILEMKNAEELESLELYFSITQDFLGEVKEVPLCEGGLDIPVTLENKEKYVENYIRFSMIDSCREKIDGLLEGFRYLISEDLAALKLFLPDELELVLVGTPELDFSSLQENAEYEGGYDANHKTVKRFWKIVNEFSYSQKQAFLKFVTGVPKAPVGGLKTIKFKLQRAGPDSNQLPTSYTCFNTLLLPDYSSAEKLKDRLLLGIENCEGFGLQ